MSTLNKILHPSQTKKCIPQSLLYIALDEYTLSVVHTLFSVFFAGHSAHLVFLKSKLCHALVPLPVLQGCHPQKYSQLAVLVALF